MILVTTLSQSYMRTIFVVTEINKTVLNEELLTKTNIIRNTRKICQLDAKILTICYGELSFARTGIDESHELVPNT